MLSSASLLSGYLLHQQFKPPGHIDTHRYHSDLQASVRQHPLALTPYQVANLTQADPEFVGEAVFSAMHDWRPVSVPILMHRLKCARFGSEEMPQAHFRETLRMLLSDPLCKQFTPGRGGNYLLRSEYGIRPVLLGSLDAGGLRGEAHYAQLIMKLGEAGVPREEAVFPHNAPPGTVGDLVADAIAQYRPEKEQDFILPALAMWLPNGVTHWTNKFQTSYSFDDAVSRLLDGPNQSACGGTHRLYALAVILNCQPTTARLSSQMVDRVQKYLSRAASVLEGRQDTMGGWTTSWNPDVDTPYVWGSSLLDKLAIDGHHLEWMAYVPDACRTSHAAIGRAIASLRKSFDALPEMQYRKFKYQLPLAHAARALCALSGTSSREALRAVST